MDMSFLFSIDSMMALVPLTALEIVLGIDNIIFIAILTGRLPSEQQHSTRIIGLTLALVMRVVLLFSIFWIMQLTTPLFSIPVMTEIGNGGDPLSQNSLPISGRDIILIFGGLFLITKATYELHHLMAREQPANNQQKVAPSVVLILTQIALLDAVFSLDSVITAVGKVDEIEIMIIAVLIAMLVMILFVGTISDFVTKYPSIKTLALAFLVMIGVLLVADGLGQHLPRGYIYFAMIFSLLVELINLRAGSRRRLDSR